MGAFERGRVRRERGRATVRTAEGRTTSGAPVDGHVADVAKGGVDVEPHRLRHRLRSKGSANRSAVPRRHHAHAHRTPPPCKGAVSLSGQPRWCVRLSASDAVTLSARAGGVGDLDSPSASGRAAAGAAIMALRVSITCGHGPEGSRARAGWGGVRSTRRTTGGCSQLPGCLPCCGCWQQQ